MPPTDGRPKRPIGPDTRDAMASARTVPSDPGSEDARLLVTGDTQLADPAPSISSPRLPREGGEVLGNRYEILGELGRGGEGVVYRARDLKADAIVALKMLQHEEGADHRLKRFRRELAMARKVTHPNVVRIHDLVELPGRFGLSMELVDGEPLDERIAHGTLSSDALVRLALDLAHALAAAHEAGVTHRDLKPGNVLLRASDGRAMVTDFGVSRAHGAAIEEVKLSMARDATPLKLTREGAIIGTPQYMAPEQLDGQIDIGPAADVYAYGVLLYEAATGTRLHEAETLGELRKLRTGAPAPSLREKRGDLPRALCDVVDKCLQREIRDRYPSGKELLAAVEPIASPPAKVQRHLVWIAIATAIVLAGGVVLARQSRSKAPPAAASAGVGVAPTPPLSLHVTNVKRITFGDGCEEFPTFTPDGKTVIYDGTVGRDAFVYALDIGGGAPRQLTQVRGWDIAAAVSPDGKRMAFVRFEGEQVGTFVAPLDGSQAPRLLAQGGVRPSWTRDGRAVWAGDGSPLTAYDVDTGKAVKTVGGSLPVRTAQTLELADGSLVAAVPVFEATDSNHCVVQRYRADGSVQKLLDGSLDEVVALSPDARHVLTSRTLAASSAELIDVPLDGSPVTSLAGTGVSARKGMGFSGDGKHLTWSTCAEQPQIVRFDARGRIAGTLEGDLASPSSLAAIPGTSLIAVVSSRAGKPEPWIASLGNDTAPRSIPIGALSAREIAVSPDGTRFALAVPDGGIYVGSLSGDPALRRVTEDGLDSDPAFYQAGSQVAFVRRQAKAPARVMMVPFDGGAVSPLLEVGSEYPAICAPSERVVYLSGATSARVVPKVWDARSGAPRVLSPALAEGRYTDPRCAPDGKHVLIVRGDTEIVEVDVATGALTRTVSTPAGDQLAEPTYTPVGVAAIRVHFQGNVWLADASF